MKKYKKNFHEFQTEYLNTYPNALAMRKHLPNLKNKSILDVGCGSGIDLAYFSTQKPKVLAGCDISQELINIAIKNVPSAEIREESFTYLSYKEKTFDVIWSKYALNHAESILLPLLEINRVLKDNGIFLLQVTHPFRTALMSKSADYFDESNITYPISNGESILEIHRTISSWVNSITESGFRILKIEEILNRPEKEYKNGVTPSAIIFILKKDEK
jgi:ubiquinone/menaquinone biosynthesis C-methylase UbiE